MTLVRSASRYLLAAAVVALASTALARTASLPQPQWRTPQVLHAKEPIDINTASLDQLLKVPGMTRTWAQRIIRFRPYRAKNDLIDRGVVSQQVYGRIKDYIIAHRANQ